MFRRAPGRPEPRTGGHRADAASTRGRSAVPARHAHPRDRLDSSTLLIPIVGFLPGDDDRVTGTIGAVRAELGRDGFVTRYSTTDTDDGLPGTEGQFLACSFWLVSALALNRRVDEARALFARLAGLSNDVGLLAEEYDVPRRRQVGNFPQAFSHPALIQAAGFIDRAAEQEAPRRRATSLR